MKIFMHPSHEFSALSHSVFESKGKDKIFPGFVNDIGLRSGQYVEKLEKIHFHLFLCCQLFVRDWTV